ncbi:hypothetical protein BLS_004568 [Venturia inaequalis]|uniref:Uncharacterized protein n=1 Tax=Venturia inaequalis TaxID=5025 RepID=A0A8H3VA27_VENIN|nr:hypothetical protein BLS_004568 [Venturia inaequalis]KAE9986300.1 hypothetical protein EG328_006031 [Venturia inaequalis]KAE9993988.1 hypothetical protein EG327_002028 [Venturia inaequalis]RDI81661.1 hypothetical protein Vi05172_g8374 [Venturia inaequalis]
MDPNRMRGMGDAYESYYGGPPTGADRGRKRGREHSEEEEPSKRGRGNQGSRQYQSTGSLDRGHDTRPGQAAEPGQFRGYNERGRSTQTEYHGSRGASSREPLHRPQAGHVVSEISRGRVRRTPSERARLEQELDEKYGTEDGGYLIGDPTITDFKPEPTAEEKASYCRRLKGMEDWEKRNGRPWPSWTNMTDEECDAQEAEWGS